MKHQAKSIRTFIGAKNFNESRQFYQELGFEEAPISDKMTLFKVNDSLAFYLQNHYVKDWVNNTMVFLEVENADTYWQYLNDLGLHHKYKYVRLTEVKKFDWGKECFMHDPSGVLWHFGEFN